MTNPCNGEFVKIQGQEDITITQTFDGATGSHFNQHIVTKGKGQALVTLTNYNYSDETETSYQVPGPPVTIASEVVTNIALVSNGPEPNFIIRIRTHFTLNANAVPTATTPLTITRECRG